MLIRQGDVVIESVATIQGTHSPLPHATLAQGEITGHSHRIENPADVELYNINGTLFLRVKSESASLIHQEHATLQIPKGDYKVWRQREYTPREIRLIRD
ncbi:MAG TPA: hypothetical protein VEJ63_13955 [Planctomycetota bacterium]|nr:hypothetical protein [Planctomycetota bacterium]